MLANANVRNREQPAHDNPTTPGDDRAATMRVLVTWGTKLGGTEGIARIIGESLHDAGCDVTLLPASAVGAIASYDAVIVGGALYANRWHHDARRFVARNVAALRRVPVWLFSSGPLDDSATRGEIPPTTQVAVLMERIGARGHRTFGGRLSADVKGFPAAAMARTMSGDYRDPARIRAWAAEIAGALPDARPGVAIDHPARSPARLAWYAILGWAASAAVLYGLLAVTSSGLAIAAHTIAMPLVFTVIALAYFGARGAREPLATALVFTAVAAILDAGVAGLVTDRLALFAHFTATWLPLGLTFLATYITGFLLSTLPWPKAPARAPAAARGPEHFEPPGHKA